MTIDLDSFFESNKSGMGSTNKDPKLDFQKEVEERIQKVQTQAQKGDFEFLTKVYEEIKKFEEDLPSKFLGIEKESNLALKNIGDRYSKEFISRVKENVGKLTQLIKEEIINIDKNISSNNFAILLDHFSKALKYYNSFPKEFFLQKNQVGIELRKREIQITKKLENYKRTEIESIKKQIHNDVLILNSLLRPGEIKQIEEIIEKLHHKISTVPKIFLASLTQERIIVSESIIKAESFLQEEYLRVFSEKEKLINNFIEKFHSHILNNDLENVLTIYNQILIEFELLPEVFLEKKMIVYQSINDLYGLLNNLIIKNSVSNFLESYNYSKIFEEIREYLEHARVTGKYEIKNLLLLKDKLIKIPKKYSSDKEMLNKQILTLINKAKQENHNMQKRSYNRKNEPSTPFSESHSSFINPQNTQINKKLFDEINSHYKNLKSTNSVTQAKLIYRKICFCIDLLHVPQSEKNILLNKVENVLNSKQQSAGFKR